MTAQHDRAPKSTEDWEPTQVLGPTDEDTSTFRLGPADEQAPSDEPGSADGEDTSTFRLGPADEQAPSDEPGSADGEDTSTFRLGPADEQAPSDGPGSADGEYSATVLASHWIQRPEPDATLVGPLSTEIPSPSPQTRPDRAEGTVLRFGPGVTAAVAHRTHRVLPAAPPPLMPPRRRLRRHTLPALVLISVIAFLAWQRLGPSVAVRTAVVTAQPTVVGCDDTADIVGLVATNGRPGSLSYRWIRSDGTSSGVLREVVVQGQRRARLHLLWTFQGKGHYTARAELRILSPTERTVTTHLTYECP